MVEPFPIQERLTNLYSRREGTAARSVHLMLPLEVDSTDWFNSLVLQSYYTDATAASLNTTASLLHYSLTHSNGGTEIPSRCTGGAGGVSGGGGSGGGGGGGGGDGGRGFSLWAFFRWF